MGLAQLLVLVRHCYPERDIVAVGDGGYALLKLLDRCRRLKKKQQQQPITFSSKAPSARRRPL